MLSTTDLFLIFMFILVYFLVLVILAGFVYWLGGSLFFFNFNNLKNTFNFYFFFFLSLFLPFLLSRVADRVLVLWHGVRPEPLRWESRVQDTGPPETSWPHVISIGESSHRDLCLNTKTQLHPMASKLQ